MQNDLFNNYLMMDKFFDTINKTQTQEQIIFDRLRFLLMELYILQNSRLDFNMESINPRLKNWVYALNLEAGNLKQKQFCEKKIEIFLKENEEFFCTKLSEDQFFWIVHWYTAIFIKAEALDFETILRWSFHAKNASVIQAHHTGLAFTHKNMYYGYVENKRTLLLEEKDRLSKIKSSLLLKKSIFIKTHPIFCKKFIDIISECSDYFKENNFLISTFIDEWRGEALYWMMEDEDFPDSYLNIAKLSIIEKIEILTKEKFNTVEYEIFNKLRDIETQLKKIETELFENFSDKYQIGSEPSNTWLSHSKSVIGKVFYGAQRLKRTEKLNAFVRRLRLRGNASAKYFDIVNQVALQPKLFDSNEGNRQPIASYIDSINSLAESDYFALRFQSKFERCAPILKRKGNTGITMLNQLGSSATAGRFFILMDVLSERSDAMEEYSEFFDFENIVSTWRRALLYSMLGTEKESFFIDKESIQLTLNNPISIKNITNSRYYIFQIPIFKKFHKYKGNKWGCSSWWSNRSCRSGYFIWNKIFLARNGFYGTFIFSTLIFSLKISCYPKSYVDVPITDEWRKDPRIKKELAKEKKKQLCLGLELKEMEFFRLLLKRQVLSKVYSQKYNWLFSVLKIFKFVNFEVLRLFIMFGQTKWIFNLMYFKWKIKKFKVSLNKIKLLKSKLIWIILNLFLCWKKSIAHFILYIKKKIIFCQKIYLKNKF